MQRSGGTGSSHGLRNGWCDPGVGVVMSPKKNHSGEVSTYIIMYILFLLNDVELPLSPHHTP